MSTSLPIIHPLSLQVPGKLAAFQPGSGCSVRNQLILNCKTITLLYGVAISYTDIKRAPCGTTPAAVSSCNPVVKMRKFHPLLRGSFTHTHCQPRAYVIWNTGCVFSQRKKKFSKMRWGCFVLIMT